MPGDSLVLFTIQPITIFKNMQTDILIAHGLVVDRNLGSTGNNPSSYTKPFR